MKIDLYESKTDGSLYVVTTETMFEFKLRSFLDFFMYSFWIIFLTLWAFGFLTISWAGVLK